MPPSSCPLDCGVSQSSVSHARNMSGASSGPKNKSRNSYGKSRHNFSNLSDTSLVAGNSSWLGKRLTREEGASVLRRQRQSGFHLQHGHISGGVVTRALRLKRQRALIAVPRRSSRCSATPSRLDRRGESRGAARQQVITRRLALQRRYAAAPLSRFISRFLSYSFLSSLSLGPSVTSSPRRHHPLPPIPFASIFFLLTSFFPHDSVSLTFLSGFFFLHSSLLFCLGLTFFPFFFRQLSRDASQLQFKKAAKLHFDTPSRVPVIFFILCEEYVDYEFLRD